VIAGDDVLTLTHHTWAVIGLVAVAVAGIGAVLTGAWQVIVAIVNERKRSQPVVIAHDAGARQFGNPGTPNTLLPTYLTNDGGGNAFNVRFGIDFDGVRYAWKYAPEDSDAGSYQRVVHAGARLPEGGETFRIEIPWEKFVIGRDTDARRVYWCQYENAYGKTWETRNPVDRSSGLDIRRVRFLRLRMRLQERRRTRTAKKAREGLQRDLAAMAAQVEEAEAAAQGEQTPPPDEDTEAEQ
jgi:hypothetical protein